METERMPADHIKAAHDSVDLINEIIAKGDFDQDALDTLKRNADHLEITSGRDYATDFAADVAVFATAIAAAKAQL